jgi:hypothetical protein
MSGDDRVRWTKGYTQSELDRAQRRFGLVFPPDLIALLRRRRPVEGHDWTDDRAIDKRSTGPSKDCFILLRMGSCGGRNGDRGRPVRAPVKKRSG